MNLPLLCSRCLFHLSSAFSRLSSSLGRDQEDALKSLMIVFLFSVAVGSQSMLAESIITAASGVKEGYHISVRELREHASGIYPDILS